MQNDEWRIPERDARRRADAEGGHVMQAPAWLDADETKASDDRRAHDRREPADYGRKDDYAARAQSGYTELGYGRHRRDAYSDADNAYRPRESYTAHDGVNGYRRGAHRADGPRRNPDRTDAPRYANAAGRDASPVFGGREHDNIHSADMRPNVGWMPIIIMAAVAAALVLFAPMLLRAWNSHAALGGGGAASHSAMSGISVTAHPDARPPMPENGNDAAAVAPATAGPTAVPTPTPLPDNLIVSQYTGRMLDRNRPAVAITYDDGPSRSTPRILDAFEANGGLATFFLVGERVKNYADTAKREYTAGFLVGTHLYSHQKLTKMSRAEVQEELDKCNAAHMEVLGVRPQLARPPYGSANDMVKEVLDMPLINWSLNSNDWQTRNADRIYNDVMNEVQDGDIILFHDLKEFSAEATERILPELVAQGYQLLTVQELFELKGRTPEAGVLYRKRVTAPE